MDTRRFVLYMAAALVGLSLWNAWHVDYPPQPLPAATEVATSQPIRDEHLLPAMTKDVSEQSVQNQSEGTATSKSASQVKVQTDVLDIAIDLNQGDIVSAQLLNYPISVEEKDKPFPLLQNNPDERYNARSSIFIVEDQKTKVLDFDFSTAQPLYQMTPDQKELQVSLSGKTADGLDVTKTFSFTKGSYLINVDYRIANNSSKDWRGFMNTQLLRSSPKEDKSSIFHIGSYTGASLSIPGTRRYQKVSFAEMAKHNLGIDVTGGWVAMQQHYFLSSWVPDPKSTNTFYTRSLDDTFTIGMISKQIDVPAQTELKVSSKLYVGPEDTTVLKGIAPYLDLTVDYGFLWFLSSILFTVLKTIYNFVGNWGWSIVLVTVLVKLAFYKLSATSYRSMAGMRKIQPKLLALRERYGEDKVKVSQATMDLYKQEKINPLGGCLPIVIQIPVFIALYWVLLESVELRQAPFIFWIKDLASADPYHILPLIMGATMLVQQKLNPAPPDPLQARIMMFLPLMFTALFWNFPAGLVLYWIVNNTLSIAQQWYITRKYSEEKPAKKLAAPAK